MMEFLLTMAVIALVFIAATIVVAMVAGAVMKARESLKKDAPDTVGSE